MGLERYRGCRARGFGFGPSNTQPVDIGKRIRANALDGWHVHLAGKPGFQQNASMKTTLDLPDELVRRVKMRAIQSDRKLKDMVATLLDAGLRAEPTAPVSAAPPKPVRLRGRGRLTAVDIERAISNGRD